MVEPAGDSGAAQGKAGDDVRFVLSALFFVLDLRLLPVPLSPTPPSPRPPKPAPFFALTLTNTAPFLVAQPQVLHWGYSLRACFGLSQRADRGL